MLPNQEINAFMRLKLWPILTLPDVFFKSHQIFRKHFNQNLKIAYFFLCHFTIACGNINSFSIERWRLPSFFIALIDVLYDDTCPCHIVPPLSLLAATYSGVLRNHFDPPPNPAHSFYLKLAF